MNKYSVEVNNERKESFILVEAADGYCAEIAVRKLFPKAKIVSVHRLVELDSFYQEYLKEIEKCEIDISDTEIFDKSLKVNERVISNLKSNRLKYK